MNENFCKNNDVGNCKYCRVVPSKRVCENRPSFDALHSTHPLNPLKLAAQCGGRELHARAFIDDHMLRHAMEVSRVEDHVRGQLSRHLGNAIANEYKDLMVSRKGDHLNPWDAPSGPRGTTYEAEVVVFTMKDFNKFTEALIGHFGEREAAARIKTKKAKLKQDISAAIEAA